ncbi:MAG: DUF1844 domain-containing protein [Candidatus Brocadiia bacterium]|nr:DUF1844 domain-containing protein [Candidatus Brocadiia bacterium]
MSEGQDRQEEAPQEDSPRADEDWKKTVAEERERLREQKEEPARPEGEPAQEPSEQPEAGAETDEAAEADEPQPRRLPEPDFRTFLAGLYTQTLMALGEVEHPVTKEKCKALPEASFLIDTIDMLRDKTEGNLTSDEQGYLNALLHDLRMRYVEATGGAEE